MRAVSYVIERRGRECRAGAGGAVGDQRSHCALAYSASALCEASKVVKIILIVDKRQVQMQSPY